MIEIKILIPVRANDGAVFSSRHHGIFEAKLTQLFGGFSLEPGRMQGGWEDEGKVYKDHCRIYLVFLSSLTKGNDVASAVTFAKAHYAQLAVTIRYLGLAEIL